MKVRSGFFFGFLILSFFALFVYEAYGWRLQARLYPWAIGIPMILLAVAHLVLDLKGANEKKNPSVAPTDFQFSQTTDPILARRRTLNIFSWMLGFFVGVWLLGFFLAVPLLVFCYLKVQAREGWVLSAALTGIAWLILWGLFDRLLHLPFPEGQIFTWMGL